jgi:hypothetical protein
MTTKPKQIQFRVGDLMPDLEARCDAATGESHNISAKRDLETYYAFLRNLRARLGLTQPEIMATIAVHNGCAMDPLIMSAQLIWANVEDADAGELEQWGVDQSSLVAKLRALDSGQRLAVADAIRRWWIADEDAQESIISEIVGA